VSSLAREGRDDLNGAPAVTRRVGTRILFVDDEPSLLQAMKLALHDMQGEWNMEFVSSGAAALASLAKLPADVIVTDMLMPVMDGWQLLAEVKRLYPQTSRLVLSGNADQKSIMRSVGTAQIYLAKPCGTGTLKAAIAQTQSLKGLLSSDWLAKLVGEVGSLPSPPKAFQEIMACIQNPLATLADAAKIIVRDAAMTANIMKLVNSAFFGARSRVASVDRAVAYLGLNTLSALVLGHGVFQSSAPVKIAGFSMEALWKHSQETALAARAISVAERLPAVSAEEAFLAGLLHDIGRVLFATRIVSGGDDAAQMEVHHGEVGAYLLGLWGFPNSIVEAVAYHHVPSRAAAADLSLVGIVHIADRLIHARSGKISLTSINYGIETGYLENLGLVHRLPKWCEALAALDSSQVVPVHLSTGAYAIR
jgi:putative nucleotidyltransferase with HDIG domain